MVFQQDNAPGHIGEVVPNFVAQKQLGVLDRPAYCPDLNSIENIWPILKKTCEVNQIGIWEKFDENITGVWNNTDSEVVRNLYYHIKITW